MIKPIRYYLNQNLIDQIKNNNYEFTQGIVFNFNNYKGSILDFIKINFLYFENFDKLSVGLLKYNYFMHSSDIIEIVVENDIGEVVTKIGPDSCYNVLFGQFRNDFLSLSWINGSLFKLKIKKVEKYIHFIPKLYDINLDFLEYSFKDFLNSYPEEKKRSLLLKESLFENKVMEYLIIIENIKQNKKILLNLKKFLETKDIFFLFESFGFNYFNFWKDEFIKKEGD